MLIAAAGIISWYTVLVRLVFLCMRVRFFVFFNCSFSCFVVLSCLNLLVFCLCLGCRGSTAVALCYFMAHILFALSLFVFVTYIYSFSLLTFLVFFPSCFVVSCLVFALFAF